MEKRCNLCREVKPLDDFYVMQKAPDGRGYSCKPCSRARSRKWNQDNPERARASQLAYWSRHAEEKNAKRRERNANDSEHLARRAEQRRRNYAENREEDLRKSREWRASPAGQAWKAEYLERTRERRRAVYVQRTYGITPDAYDQMIAEQGGACAICGQQPEKTWSVDHDHSCCSGAKSCGSCIRGLLCDRCNRGIGFFGDDPERLLAAARYLARHRNP